MQTTDGNNNVTNIAYTDGLLQSSVTTTPTSGPAQKVVTNLGLGTVTTIDTVPGGSMQVVSKSWLDDAGRTLETEQYDGKGDTYTTYQAYDDSGRLYWTKDAVGTITETEFDGLGRPTQIWVGTSDVNEPHRGRVGRVRQQRRGRRQPHPDHAVYVFDRPARYAVVLRLAGPPRGREQRPASHVQHARQPGRDHRGPDL